MARRELERALLTPAETAARLRVSRSTLRRWRFEGGGPPSRKLGPRTVRYERSALDEWVDGRPT